MKTRCKLFIKKLFYKLFYMESRGHLMPWWGCLLTPLTSMRFKKLPIEVRSTIADKVRKQRINKK